MRLLRAGRTGSGYFTTWSGGGPQLKHEHSKNGVGSVAEQRAGGGDGGAGRGGGGGPWRGHGMAAAPSHFRSDFLLLLPWRSFSARSVR
jgi:hypothetical protein